MNISIAKKRMSRVLAVDSINSSQADFLATHVPFRKVTLSSNVNGNSVKEYLSESDVYSKLFNQEKSDEHRFVIVEGSNGAGKSHFIRWINAKLDSEDNASEVVLLIKRSDNTLKGTIRQLLEKDEIKNIANKEAYERLVRANQTISEQKFKATIYNSFIVEIQSDEKEGGLSNVEKKDLVAFLQNEDVQAYMMRENGPVERIYSKVSGNGVSNGNNDAIAQFTVQDFSCDMDFIGKLEYADRRAKKMANKLLVDDGDISYVKNITDYMDSFIDKVIQSCSGIQSGDFEMIFKDIRKELFRQGKSLTLLIEDITSFTGLNQELLSALFTSHTGENSQDNLCRLVSIVGTTTEYFRDYFRDNYRDRITSRITIDDGAIGENRDDLVQFFARYLNAMSVDNDELEAWRGNGASPADMPVHSDPEANIWGAYTLNDKKLSLFPFTKNAIVNLVAVMEKPTPRYIIRTIIEPAINELINAPTVFPNFCKSWRSQLESNIKNEDIINRINNIVQNMGQSATYAERIRKLIGFWGDATIEYKNGRLAGLPSAIYKELQLGDFFEKVTGVNVGAVISKPDEVVIPDPENTENVSGDDGTVVSPVVPPVDPEATKRQEKYLEFRDMVNTWHNNPDKKLTRIQDIRDAVCNFVFETLNWQQYGIPTVLMKTVKESQYSLIAFARQDQKLDKSYIVLDDNDETYHLLLCFGKYHFLGKKTWNFDDSESEIYTATLWLERHKKEIIETVRGDIDSNVPLYVKNAIILDVVSKALNGTINATKLSDIKRETILRKDNVLNKSIRDNSGHCKEWIDVLNLCYPNGNVAFYEDFLLKYFNIIMGATDDAKKMIVNQSLFSYSINAVKSSKFTVESEQELGIDEKTKSRRELIEQCSKIFDKAQKALEIEISKGKEVLKKILSYFGFELDDDLLPDKSDINKMLTDIKGFYEDAFRVGYNINSKKSIAEMLSQKTEEIEKSIAVLAMDFDSKSPVEKLLLFSNDPIGKLTQFMQLLEAVDNDVDGARSYVELEKEKLIKKGAWDENKDPRFADAKSEFDVLYSKIKEAE